jgi:hypothetical protein
MKRLAMLLSLGTLLVVLFVAGGCKTTRYSVNFNYEFAPNSSVNVTLLDK